MSAPPRDDVVFTFGGIAVARTLGENADLPGETPRAAHPGSHRH